MNAIDLVLLFRDARIAVDPSSDPEATFQDVLAAQDLRKTYRFQFIDKDFGRLCLDCPVFPRGKKTWTVEVGWSTSSDVTPSEFSEFASMIQELEAAANRLDAFVQNLATTPADAKKGRRALDKVLNSLTDEVRSQFEGIPPRSEWYEAYDARVKAWLQENA